MLKTLLAEVKQYKRDFIIAPIFTVLEVFMEVLLPFIMALLIDEGISAGNMGKVVTWSIVMIVVACCSMVFGLLACVYTSKAAGGLAANLREAMFTKLQTYSFSNIDRFSTSGLVTRMTTDVTNVLNAVQAVVRQMARAPIMLVCCVVLCLFISPSLSLIFAVALICLALVVGIVSAKANPIFNKVFDKYDDLNESVEENVSAIRVVKSFVREDYEDEKFQKASGKLYDMFVKAEGLVSINNPAMMVALFGVTLAMSWFGANYVVEGVITTGELTSLFGYVMQMLMSLMTLAMAIVQVTMSASSAKRICEVLTEEPDIKNPENAITEVPDGSVDFNHVTFSYKAGAGEAVLEDIDLHFKSGETIGIFGGTGSGKTSLVNLISRLYDVNEGSVCVGGHDVREYDLETLRNKVAVVLQKNELFSGTVAENLRWGKEDATDEELRHACDLAGASEFVDTLPQGYDTKIEQGGTNVSGGQKQRLCIARALLKDPKVLILDDSTSAVDTATDARIQDALTNDLPEMTKIIISQRVSSLASADRIVVLDEGRVAGFGTEEELLKTNDIYREVYEQQTKGGGGGDFDMPAPETTARPAAAAQPAATARSATAAQLATTARPAAAASGMAGE